MNAIVSVTEDWGIGYKGGLLVRNRKDMSYFKSKTMGGTVLCGQNTFLSFPGGALEGRRNLVLSLDPSFEAPGIEVFANIGDALGAVRETDPNDVWVIGGESIYRQLLPMCKRAYVTKNAVRLPADAYFPNLDNDPMWHVESIEKGGVTKTGIPYSFVTYAR